MLKSIVLAATLAALGGLSLQPAMAQATRATRSADQTATVQADVLSAKNPQGEHVRVDSPLNQVAEASDVGAPQADNTCIAQDDSSGCSPAAAESSTSPVREKNDVSRHRQFETRHP